LLLSVFGVPARAAARPAPGQNAAANLSGTVEDETGAAIAEADISIINANTGLQRGATTDDRGYFVIPLLPVGTYVLTARMPGFATVMIRDIQVHAGIDVSLSIRLKPKRITETIDVIADGDAGSGSRVSDLDASDAAAKYSVTNREVMNLPVFANELGRNTLQSLPFLVPGVAPDTTLGVLAGLNVAGIVVRGSRSSAVSFNIEGTDDNDDEYNLALAGLPNPDTLEEFTFITSNYQADLGRSAGGIINAVVKSGTTHLKGNIRYLGIDDKLNARGFFDSRTPLFRLNNFGGQLGGPASLPLPRGLRERLSFFADYEGTRSLRESTESFQVPSNPERNGDFSGLPLNAQPYDPLTGPNSTKQTRFPGGRIPGNRISPIALQYLRLFIPSPNSGDRVFAELLPTNFANDQGTLRLDYGLSEGDSINLIFLSASSRITEPTGVLPANSQYRENANSYNLIGRYTRVLSPASINQITVSFARNNAADQSFAPGSSGLDPSKFGFVGIHPQVPALLGAPAVLFDDGTRVSPGAYLASAVRTSFQAKDDFSHTLGRNSFKFGIEGRWYWEERAYAPPTLDGSFQFYYFNPTGTRNSVADFLLGLPYHYLQSTDSSAYPRRSSYQLYGVGDFRMSPELTINFGLRYELTPPAVDARDQVSAFRPGQQSSVIPQAPSGLIFVGDRDPVLGRLPRGLYQTHYRDLAPRVGMAFLPRHLPGPLRTVLGEGKTAIRAGWGVFYDHTALSSSTRISTRTEPFSDFVTVVASQNNADFANPFGSSSNPFPIDVKKRAFTIWPSLYSIDPSFRTPYTYTYDLIIQRELTATTTLEVSYLGANSFRTVRDRELNPAHIDRSSGPDFFSIQVHRLYPSIGSVTSAESSGRARSDSFQAQIRRRFSHGLMFQASYVLSRSRDNGGTIFSSINRDPLVWARSPFNRTHNVVVGFSYDLPQLKVPPHLKTLFSGWRTSGIIELRSGLPLDIFQFTDSTFAAPGPLETGLPDLLGGFRRTDPRSNQTLFANGFAQTGHFFFDPSAFRVVAPADYTQARSGNLPPMVFDGPGFNMWSLSVAKDFKIVRGQRITVRADIRNLFNHANFDTPNVQADSPAFGQVTSAAPGRTIQFSARYVF
jgi:hypothetical protein